MNIYTGKDDNTLSEKIDEIIAMRDKAFVRARFNKFCLIGLCIIGSIISSFEMYYYALEFEVSFEITLSIFALIVAGALAFINNYSFVGNNTKKELQTAIKTSLYQYIIQQFNASASFEPISDRTYSVFNIGKILNKKITEVSEEDFIHFSHNDVDYCISEALMLNGVKKVFDGLMIIATIKNNTGLITEFQDEIEKRLSDAVKEHKGQVYRHNNQTFILIPNTKDLFHINLNTKKSKIYKKVFDDIDYLNFTFPLINTFNSIIDNELSSEKYKALTPAPVKKLLGEHKAINSSIIGIKFLGYFILFFGAIGTSGSIVLGALLILAGLTLITLSDQKIYLFETNTCISKKKIFFVFSHSTETELPPMEKIVVKRNRKKKAFDIFLKFPTNSVLLNTYTERMETVRKVKLLCEKSGLPAEWK